LYKFFNDRGYCSNLSPRMYERKLTNNGNSTLQIKVYNGYEFNTFTFRSFNWIHKLLYKKGKKYIKRDLAKYITPLALAIWIMNDGDWAKPGVRLSTNAFKLEDVQFLASILTNKWGLKCTIQKLSKSNQYYIYVLGESLPILRKLLLPYIVTSMKYKLGSAIAKSNIK
jgi:ubiquinol-cytochrome c reductase cytochrome b subunit